MEKKKKKTVKVNLKKVSIILFVIGIIYVIAGITITELWEYIQAYEWGIVMLVEGIVFIGTACGLIIKQLLPEKKFIICMVIGYLTVIIGVIAAAIIKSINKNKEYSGDKYQNLERLQKLKEQGVITEEEFNAEKKKILG